MNSRHSLFRTEALKHYEQAQGKQVVFAAFKRHSGQSHRRVPLRMQQTSSECGAACLAMILSYFGRNTRVAECRSLLGLDQGGNRNGSSAQAIAQAARTFGLRVQAFALHDLAQFPQVSLPAIAHWNFNHFVVIERVYADRVEIADPAQGRRKISRQEFAQSFTGVLLTFEAGANFLATPDKEATPVWRKFARQWLLSRRMLFQIGIVSLVLQGLGLGVPLFTQTLVDRVLAGRDVGLLSMLGIVTIAVLLFQSGMGYLRTRLLNVLRAQLDTRLSLNFVEHLFSLPFSFFQSRQSGDLLLRLSSNAMLREAMTNQLLSSFLDGGLALTYFVVLLIRAPLFAWLALGLGLIQLTVTLCTQQRLHQLSQCSVNAQAESQNYLVEAIGGVSTIKASAAEDRVLHRWTNLLTAEVNAELNSNTVSASVNTLMSLLQMAGPILILWIGASQVLHGTLSLGELFGLNAITVSFLAPLSGLVMSARHLQQARVHVERLADVLDEMPEQSVIKTSPPSANDTTIELKHVNFQYGHNMPPVLQDISLRITSGQKVALVGSTGSGKSTLARLLLGLYQPTAGEVCYGDCALKDIDFRQLRSQFGVVLQESFLFSGSIRDNIVFSNSDVGLDSVMEAARLACIDRDIANMPMGYETLVGEGGRNLSGGQRQRIAIARALVQRPAILLLDEATSHLDAITEANVEAHLSALRCTRIVIAHRLSTVRNADLIVVLDHGRIIEQGNHEQLLAQQGYYAALVQSQA